MRRLKVKSHDEQSRTLAELRDALLPKLISGQIRIEEEHGKDTAIPTS